jgi:predicted ATPase/class 3 adenylate cyclase
VSQPNLVTTFLFTDIEGSTRLWEEEPERMRPALARHDHLARAAVENHRGTLVKMTGDGLHAAFDDPLDAVHAALELQRGLLDPATTHGIPLRVRCGMHAGVCVESRDNDFYGSAVNRAARIMSIAHGGQVLVSRAVAAMLDGRLPGGIGLRELGETRLKDVASPEQIYQLVDPGLRSDFPALRSLTRTPHNLPHDATTFIGREREIAEIAAMLGHSRLVTLVGMGGMGKSRLSLRVAGEAMDAFPDGVWFVELAPLQDPRLLAQAVARTLSVKEEAGRPVEEALLKYVADRQLLLILDNCEHLLQACAELAKRLLRAGARLKVLTSSREPLRIAGEASYPVPPLPVPDLRAPFEPAVLAQYEAVRLFMERAVAARPDLHLTAENSPAIAAICHRLDGIPLALELAAARVRSLPVSKIAERLTDRFRILKGGDQTALPRQQTLRALIDWSYDLLNEPERALLRELSVFAGGWTLEGAEAICECAEEDVLDLLSRLVEKSLVVLEPAGERYRLLETVRQYAGERLAEAGNGDAIRTRHLKHFVAFAETAKPELLGPDQARWLVRFDHELENLLAAHEWAGRIPEGAGLDLRLTAVLRIHWISRGQLELGQRVIMEALARKGAEERELPRVRGLFNAGWLHYLAGRYAEARACLEESLSIARDLRNENAVAIVLQPLGQVAIGMGDFALARAYLLEAFQYAELRGDARQLAAACNALAHLHRIEGDMAAAEALYERALSMARELEDPEMNAISLLNLAMVSTLQGRDSRAAALAMEALAVAGKLDAQRVVQSVLEVAAGIAAGCGKWERAVRFFGGAEALADTTGLRRDPVDEAFLAPRMRLAREALGSAAFAAAEGAGRGLPYEQLVREVRELLQSAYGVSLTIVGSHS